jgi:hypothetical protein
MKTTINITIIKQFLERHIDKIRNTFIYCVILTIIGTLINEPTIILIFILLTFITGLTLIFIHWYN